jgi:pimeloyl-ACP methyl ester carboxylesterase
LQKFDAEVLVVNNEYLSQLKLEKLNPNSEGETVVFVGPEHRIRELTLKLSPVLNCFALMPALPDPKNLVGLSERFKTLITESKLTRITLVGVEWGGAVAIHYAANNIKNVRRVLFVNALSRAKQLPIEKGLEWIERFLPLGFPFRPISKDFDPRPIIHRVRCPVLVVTQASSQIEDIKIHTKFLMDKLPNAWHAELELSTFPELLENFIVVPTKQPQKAVRNG